MQTQQIIEMARQAGMGFNQSLAEFSTPLCDGVEIEELETFAKLVAKAKAEELATELEKGPLNDTATSIAIWIRSQA